MFIDSFGAVGVGFIDVIYNVLLFLDNVRIAILVDLNLIAFFRIGVADGGDRDSDYFAVIGADFDLVVFNLSYFSHKAPYYYFYSL